MRFGVSEILTSLMLVYVAELMLDYLVRGPWRDPQGFNFPQTVTFDDGHAADPRARAAACMPACCSGRSSSWSAWFVMQPHACSASGSASLGEAPQGRRASRASTPDRMALAAFAISGALAGLAGIVRGRRARSGSSSQRSRRATASRRSRSRFSGGCIRSGMVFGALVVALTLIGGESAQIALKLPLDLTRVFQGMLLFCVLAADALVSYRVRGSCATARA